MRVANEPAHQNDCNGKNQAHSYVWCHVRTQHESMASGNQLQWICLLYVPESSSAEVLTRKASVVSLNDCAGFHRAITCASVARCSRPDMLRGTKHTQTRRQIQPSPNVPIRAACKLIQVRRDR